VSEAVLAPVMRVRGERAVTLSDRIAIERPLEIRVRVGPTTRVLSTTMRTPGEDRALAAGFLYAEGIVDDARSLLALEEVEDDAVLVELDAKATAAVEAGARRFVTSAACGVCGRESLAGMRAAAGGDYPSDRPALAAAVVHRLAESLRAAQPTFDRTGGLHAAGLFAPDGARRAVHEDVGRHNAVDKLIGALLLAGQLPARDAVLLVSGRASYELVQKAAAAGIPILAAVGAPSSAAVELASAAEMTLLGFVRDGGFNVYAGRARIVGVTG
jgi:FdhD protein